MGRAPRELSRPQNDGGCTLAIITVILKRNSDGTESFSLIRESRMVLEPGKGAKQYNADRRGTHVIAICDKSGTCTDGTVLSWDRMLG